MSFLAERSPVALSSLVEALRSKDAPTSDSVAATDENDNSSVTFHSTKLSHMNKASARPVQQKKDRKMKGNKNTSTNTVPSLNSQQLVT
jgi:hypothetical protein